LTGEFSSALVDSALCLAAALAFLPVFFLAFSVFFAGAFVLVSAGATTGIDLRQGGGRDHCA
jgi:hypothetical protein